MEGRSRHRSRSSDRYRDHRQDSSASRNRSDHRGHEDRHRSTDGVRDRYSRDFDKGERRHRDDRYGREDRYDKHSRGYANGRYRSDGGGQYRESSDRVNGRSRRDDDDDGMEDRHPRRERGSSRGRGSSSYRSSLIDKVNRREQRRSASNDSACSFGSRVSFGEDRGAEQTAEELDEEALLMRAMGFGEFSTTKNKQHLDSDASGVAKRSKRQYRQYMNRRGGFNRPLSPTL